MHVLCMKGRHRIGQVLAKGNLVWGSDAALIQISAADPLQLWPAIIRQGGQTRGAVAFSWLVFCVTSTLAWRPLWEMAGVGLGGGSGTGAPGSSLAAAQGSTLRATSNKCHLEAGEVCSRGFMENYILRKNLRQRENSYSAKGESRAF